ncbi:MAG: protein jag [Chloroflexi bacterium]|nr:protein jag [Chloroflexota bacterium]
MSEQRAMLEVIAPTVEEATAKGIAELGIREEDVNIEVLDEGSRGLLGLGGRQARVRLTVKGSQEDESAAPTDSSSPDSVDEDADNALAIARETVSELLEKMGINAEVSAHHGESDNPNYNPPIIVDISGKDLSILIGRRAETLNSLQFITRLIVGKEIGRGTHIVVDVEGYRVRRERTLRDLARRMAEQAIATGRRQKLEPMPPNERRIIHLELQEDPSVTTESIDQDPRRKVTISPVDT